MGIGTSQVVPHLSPNGLINGDFRIVKLATVNAATVPINSDDTYVFPNWLLLSDGNDRADLTQETSVVPSGDGGYAALRLDVETVSGTSEKFGICQILEARDAARFIGQDCTLSFKARTTSGAVENLRAHILAWDSTADSVTSDVVATWEDEGTNPTFATNWTAENTATDLALTNAYQTFSVTGNIDTSSAVNVGVFIHVDDTDLSAGEFVYITDVKLEVGSGATMFEHRPFQEEQNACDRSYQRYTFNSNQAVAAGYSQSTTVGAFPFIYRQEMRAIPTLALTAADFLVLHQSTATDASSQSEQHPDTFSMMFALTTAAAQTAGEGCVMRADGTDSRVIELLAEL